MRVSRRMEMPPLFGMCEGCCNRVSRLDVPCSSDPSEGVELSTKLRNQCQWVVVIIIRVRVVVLLGHVAHRFCIATWKL